MELFRLHAYRVSPARTSDGESAPSGGAVRISSELRSILGDSELAAQFEHRTLVDFDMPGSQRRNEMRELMLSFAFDAASAAKASAKAIAERLSNAMDLRSTPCLMILSANRDEKSRSVTIWTFPRDRAFQMNGAGGAATIQILTDIFSQTSKLRKAATFAGRRSRSEFLQGRVLDFQAGTGPQAVADFWIERFLSCKLSINDDAGTKLLADTIKMAVKACDSVEDQEQIVTGAMAVRISPRRRWSLRDFAETYLTGAAEEHFKSLAPNEDSYGSLFNLVRGPFEAALAFRVFTLDTGILVSSPVTEIGSSVLLTGDKHKTLSCKGRVVSERVRATRGG